MTRVEAIKWFKLMKEKFENTEYADALDMAIEALEQESKCGEWIGIDRMPDMPRYKYYRCSNCKMLNDRVVNFCPKCGAQMKAGENK